MGDKTFQLATTNIKKVNDVPREPAARLYCYSTATTWVLQVRGPMQLANGRDGQDFIVATAYLTLKELEAIHAAITGEIAEARIGR